MSDNSKIEWTDATWTPIQAIRKDNGKAGVSCVKVSPECANCYSERFNMRALPGHGTGLPFTVLASKQVETFLNLKILAQPLHWKRPRKIFVCSQTDLFGDWVTDDILAIIFAVMALAPQHTFQVLTKRPERARRWIKGSTGTMNNAIALMTSRIAREMFGQTYRGCELPYLGENDDAICTVANGKWPLPKQWGEWDECGERVGKKRAGRLLDGREWSEFPPAEERSGA